MKQLLMLCRSCTRLSEQQRIWIHDAKACDCIFVDAPESYDTKGLFIVMGATSKRVFDKYPDPMSYETATRLAGKHSMAMINAGLSIRFYITPVLDV